MKISDQRQRRAPAVRRSFMDFLVAEHFAGPVEIINTAIGVIGVAGAAITATAVFRELTRALPGLTELRIYVEVTYALSISMIAAWVVLYRKASAKLYEQSRKGQDIARLQHSMAEIVRRFALLKGAWQEPGSLNDDPDLRRLLESELPAYLRRRVGHHDTSITVKYFVEAPDPNQRPVLEAVFRHVHDRNRASRRPPTTPGLESVVMERFLRNPRTLQYVLVPDTEALEMNVERFGDVAKRNRAYAEHARGCGFRSVLAFPLREPIPLGPKRGVEANGIRGFLSFDSPAPNAFRPLFQGDDHDVGHLTPHVQAEADFQFFFGLADCLATLAMLRDESGLPGTRTDEADS